MNQNATEPVTATETLAEVPEHVLRGLPEEVRLFPSAVDKTRIGVWATKPILKGKKFGPFVGDKKKRSQVKNNVYMWEVYYPNLGWMCIDATDPEKGNWLRYVNWACSGEEQNLFPLEINRAIYYKTLKPIAPGEELLVWYNGEDNPEIAAAIEEERASARSKRNSPKSKKGKKKSQENKSKGNKTEDLKVKTSEPESTPANMRDSAEGIKEEDEKPSASAVEQTDVLQEEVVSQDVPPEVAVASPACASQIEPDETQGATPCEVNDLEDEEDEDEDEEDELEEEGEEEIDMPNESLGKEPEIRCDEKLEDLLEEPKILSKESLEDSPEAASIIKNPETKQEPNGDVFETFLFPCQHCERKFTTKQGLERHMHIHMSTVNHAFKCKYCGKAFGTQINRRRHERRHEAGLKRKPSLTLQPSEDLPDGKVPGETITPKEESSPPGLGQDCLTLNSEKASQETVNSSVVEENGEVKELHPCKYCKKVFGTHTNMRRHQRRVHERHLIPKGVRRKGGPEEPQAAAEQAQPTQNVYVPSTEPEEEGEGDDVYIMDISSNISENLNYYIDGKIQTNSSTSNCDVIEMESNSADLYSINCLLTPVTVEITQNIKTTQVPLSEDLPMEASGSTNSESKKRRTTSPPLLPKIKAEVDSDPVAPSCSLSLPLSISTTEAVSFHKEKTVYLSSQLKQLLQTQEKRTSPAGISAPEMPKLGPPPVSAAASLLPVTSSRFKRRTSSPPSSPQHSPALRDFGKQSDNKAVWPETVLNSKKPKLESHSSSPAWSVSGRDERETVSPPCFDEYKIAKEWAVGPAFSSVCNQQPLDLSSGVKQKAEGAGKTPVQWESVLDLSVHKKLSMDSEGKESKENHSAQPASSAVKKKKPTTCMLQKVLLNEYNGIDVPVDSTTDVTRSPSPRKSLEPQPDADLGPESSLCAPTVESPADVSPSSPTLQTSSLSSGQLPPLLIPTNPSSPPPCPPVLTVATPPPPLLPTVPLPLPAPPSDVSPRPCPSPLSNTTAQSPLPILSPTGSPSPSPVPSVEPLVSAASPGPPTLSSSSSSSSSSFSSSSSSSSPSPPPLSAVSSVVSSGDNLEASLPMISFKQEELEHDALKPREEPQPAVEQDVVQETFTKNFVCNVCESPFLSIKDLTKHLSIHAEEWPFKCEFCVQLFKGKTDLSEHRFLLHGVENIFVCSVCKKEFAFLCNLQQHQRDLHPDKVCTHHEFESGTLRPQNFTDPSKAHVEHMQSLPEDASETSKEEEEELNDSSEELYTTIKIMASGMKTKDPDVRLGLNQHYPSFKPPPFQYHHRNPMGIGVTATNFTTHNIPQTFTTAIRCTKCGKGVDNMPELHKHILACASASDKKRYTPKKNPVPLKQTVQPKNGVVVLENSGKNAFRRMGQPKRLNFSVELSKMSSNKLKLNALKKKNQLVQKAILQKNKAAKQKADLKNASESSSHICPYCNREFTYIGSLNKHAAFSCPKKPLSPSKKKASHSSKKGGHSSPASSDKNSNHRRRTADAEIKMQSTPTPLGKTRARSSGPAPVPLPSSSFRSKQNVKFVSSVKSKKPNSTSIRNSSPIRMAKITHVEGKKPKAVVKNHAAQLASKASRSLHVPVQKSKAVLQSKAALASKKRTDRFSVKSRERSGGPVTRSLQLAASADSSESRREDSSGKQELKDFSYSLRLASRCPPPAAPYITRQCRKVKVPAAAQFQGPFFKE